MQCRRKNDVERIRFEILLAKIGFDVQPPIFDKMVLPEFLLDLREETIGHIREDIARISRRQYRKNTSCHTAGSSSDLQQAEWRSQWHRVNCGGDRALNEHIVEANGW